MTDLDKWPSRLYAVILVFAVATLIQAVVDAIRMVQALRIHGWGG